MANTRFIHIVIIALFVIMASSAQSAWAQDTSHANPRVVDEVQSLPDSTALPDPIALPDTNDAPNIVDASDDEWMLLPSATLREVYEDDNPEYADAQHIENQIIDDAETQIAKVDANTSTDDIRLPNPEYSIESIHIAGNSYTSRKRILELIDLDDLDAIHMTLEELEDCRIRLALTGRFEHVEMKLRPGKESSRLRIDLNVEERSPIQVNQYYIGTDSKSTYWHGLDVTWLSMFAPLDRMRMVYAATSSNDYTLDLSYYVPSIAKLPLSLLFNIHTMNGHEGIYGPSFGQHGNRNDDFVHLDDIDFQRHGATIGMSYGITKDFRVFLRTSYDRIHRHHQLEALAPDLNHFLKRNWSNHFDLGAMIAYDTRSGHQMPNDGHVFQFGVSGTFKTKASNYQYIKMILMHQSNIQLGSPVHLLRIGTFLGGILGDAPFFEKFFYNDFYDLAPARIGILNPSSRGAFDIFSTGAKSLSYEDFLARLSISYAWQPIEQRVEFFGLVSAIWANSDKDEFIQIANKNNAKRDVFPVDMSFNLGVRMRTEYGLFSLTLAHIFNLIPR